MKILYAMQGTGNGHLCRARDIIPILQENNEVDLLVSGTQADIELPYPVKYKLNGLGFIFGENGGVDIVETYKKNYLKVYFSEINNLPVQDYDLVINDFEPVSAWACYLNNLKCITISHQSAVLNNKAPQPHDIDIIGKAILNNYAPGTEKYGFHFKPYDVNIYTPVIRQQVREKIVSDKGHYTVYLPAYEDKRLLKVLGQIENIEWQVFSKHNKKPIEEKNITIKPINNEDFIESMATSTGVLCGAGFETPAEALFMKKKLMVIPMKSQYEQQCNAAALREMGVPILKSLKVKHVEKIQDWIVNGNRVNVDYPDQTAEIINKILASLTPSSEFETLDAGKKEYTFKKFRIMLLKKIAAQL